MSALRQPPSIWLEEETNALVRLQAEIWAEFESDRAIPGGRWNEVARRLALLEVSQQPRSRKQCYNKWVRMQEIQANKEAARNDAQHSSDAEYPTVFRNSDVAMSEPNAAREARSLHDSNSQTSGEESPLPRSSHQSHLPATPHRHGNSRNVLMAPKSKHQRVTEWAKNTGMVIEPHETNAQTAPGRQRHYAPIIYTEERYADQENANGKRPYQQTASRRNSLSGIDCRECAYCPTSKPAETRPIFCCNGEFDHRNNGKTGQTLMPPSTSSCQGHQLLSEALQREQELVKSLMTQQRTDIDELQRTHRDHLRDIMQLQTQFTNELRTREETYRDEQKVRDDEYRSKEQERETRWWQALDERDQRLEKLFNELLKTMNKS